MPFDASADGIVLGEGVGVVVLKRLSRALADGDHIHGVILASGINGDGRTNGITAPSALSQAELLMRVHREAGIGPDDIGYVEAHGTGTELGDPIEAKALRQALGGSTVTRYLGSVKANIGHTTMAAGIASLLKTLLALRYGQVPPLPGFTALNDKVENADGRFVFPTELSDWPGEPDRPRIATVSSFGFSGTNCHLVAAQAPARPAHTTGTGPVVVPVSARDQAALDELRTALADALTPDHDLADVAYTLSACRTHFPVRAVVVAHDIADLRGKLRAYREPVGDPADELTALAAEYIKGADPDWTARFGDRPYRKVPLPTYPFARTRHWIGAPATDDEPDSTVPLTPDDRIVAEHRIAGVPVLPGAAFPALAVSCAVRAGLRLPVRLSSVRWLRPFEVTTRVREIVLHAPTNEKASKAQWKSLTDYLITNRMMVVRDAAQQLSRPFADSPVNDWTVPQRASALREMLDAIAAENKKLAGQIDLLEQNQFVETTSLASGRLGRAVTVFKDPAKLGEFVGDFGSLYPWVRASDLSLYRDYLRSVWVSAAQKMYEDTLHIPKPAVSLLERQLDERFQQDFHTHNDASQPAAKLLTPLLASILARPIARGGFGLGAAGIPPQAALSDADYLQVLIGKSKDTGDDGRIVHDGGSR